MPPKPTCISLMLGVLLVLLLLLLPFAVSGALVHTEQTAKTFAFLYAMTGITPLVAACLLWGNTRPGIRITRIDLALAGLFGYILVNHYLIQDLHSFSFRFYELLGLAVLYMILRQMEADCYRWLLLALVGSGFLQAAYGNLQLYGVYPSRHPGFALTGGFFNPGPYAGFLAAAGSVALGLWLFRNKLFPEASIREAVASSETEMPGTTAWKGFTLPAGFSNIFKQSNIQALLCRWLALAAVVAIGLVLPATRSRAGLLAAAAGGTYLLVRRCDTKRLWSARLNTPLKKFGTLALLVVILVGGLAGMYRVKKDSADARLLIWGATARMIQARPVAGVGFDRFKAGYMPAQADWFRDHPDSPLVGLAGNTKYGFNEWLQFTAEEGLLGLALLVVLGILIIRVNSKTNPVRLTIAKAGVLAIGVFALFSYPAQILPIKVSLILFLAVIASCGRAYVLRLPSVSRWAKRGIKVSIMALVLWGVVQAAMHIRRLHSAARQWEAGLDRYEAGNIAGSLEVYASVYPAFDQNGEFLMHYGKALSMAEEDSQAVAVLGRAKRHLNNLIIQTALGDSYKRLEWYEQAEQAYRLAAQMLPDRFYPKYLLVKLYEATGQREKLIPIATQLLAKEPKIESTAVREIKQEMEEILKLH